MTGMIVCATGLATAGLLVLGWCAVRVWLQVRHLAHEVDTACQAVARAAAGLEAAAAPLTHALAARPVEGGHTDTPRRVGFGASRR
jgi:hypothetical protein